MKKFKEWISTKEEINSEANARLIPDDQARDRAKSELGRANHDWRVPGTVICPNCHKKLGVKSDSKGKMVKCPECSRPFHVK